MVTAVDGAKRELLFLQGQTLKRTVCEISTVKHRGRLKRLLATEFSSSAMQKLLDLVFKSPTLGKLWTWRKLQ
ncbi:hypothetical protein R1flu_009593 [Riccia fluitans]|uniref:Uncharacterized protein n=1 Tax=Riccia fluitans TaxID=41844 RepID=A0ABD1Z2K3_9MARC